VLALDRCGQVGNHHEVAPGRMGLPESEHALRIERRDGSRRESTRVLPPNAGISLDRRRARRCWGDRNSGTEPGPGCAPASSCHPGARLTARQSVRDSRHAGASRPRRVAGLLYPDFMFGLTICKVCLRLPNQHPNGSGTIDLGGGLHDGRRASWASCSSHSASTFSAQHPPRSQRAGAGDPVCWNSHQQIVVNSVTIWPSQIFY